MMDPLVAGAVLITAAAFLPLVLTSFNLVAWRRGRADGVMPGPVSILIPARNEVDNIGDCLAAARASAAHELLVYDDASTDGTADVIGAKAAEDPRIRLIRGAELPRGWAGKSHACHRLALEATGDVLVFIDADVQLDSTALARIGSLFRDLDADVVSALPRQVTETWAEKLILPLLHLTYTSWLPLPLVYLSRDPRFLAVNGQVLAIRSDVYRQVGGFEAVKHEVVEDMAFCRFIKTSGFRVVFADGHAIADCRMYTSAREVWEGFSKNIYRGLGANLAALIGVFALYLTCFVAPYALGGALAGIYLAGLDTATLRPLWAAASAGIAANVALRAALAWRFHQSWTGLLTHPLSVLTLVVIGINSFVWHQRGAIRWRGRVYGHQPDLTTTAPPAR